MDGADRVLTTALYNQAIEVRHEVFEELANLIGNEIARRFMH